MKIQQNQKKSVEDMQKIVDANENIGVKDESNQSYKRVFPDRGREGLFLRAFGKRNIRKLVKKLKDAKD